MLLVGVICRAPGLYAVPACAFCLLGSFSCLKPQHWVILIGGEMNLHNRYERLVIPASCGILDGFTCTFTRELEFYDDHH